MDAKQFIKELPKLPTIHMIVEQMQHEQVRFMRLHHNARREHLDCRVDIDRESYRELLSSIHGQVTRLADELYHRCTLNGFKVYEVNTKDRLIDVTVREDS